MFSSTAVDPPPTFTLSADVPRGVNKIPECACLNGCLGPGTFADVNHFLSHILAWHSDDLARLSKVYPDCLIADYQLSDIEPLLRVIWPIKQPIHVRPIKDVSRVDAASNCQELVLGRIIRCRGYGGDQTQARMMAMLHGILVLVSGTIEGFTHPFTWKLTNAGFPPLTEEERAVLKTPLTKKLTHYTVPKGTRHFARGGFYRLNNLIKMYPEEHKELVDSGYFKTHIHRKVEELLLNIVKVDFPMYFTSESTPGSYVRVTIETDYVTLYGDGNNVIAARYNALRHLVFLAIAGHEPSAWREIMPKPTPLSSTGPAARPRYLRAREEPSVAPIRRSIHDSEVSPARLGAVAHQLSSPHSAAAVAPFISRSSSAPRPPSPDLDPPLCFGRSTFKLAPLPPASPLRAAAIPTPSQSPPSARASDYGSQVFSGRDRDRYRAQLRPATAVDQTSESRDVAPVPSGTAGRILSPPSETVLASPSRAVPTVDAVTTMCPEDTLKSLPPVPEPSSTFRDPGHAQADASAAPPMLTPPATQPSLTDAIVSATAAAPPITQSQPPPALDPASSAAPAGRPTYDELMADLNATRTWAQSLSSRVTHLETQLALLQAQQANPSSLRQTTQTSTAPSDQSARKPVDPALDPSNPHHRHLLLTPLYTPATFAATLGPSPPELAHLDPPLRAQMLTHPLLSTWLDDPFGAMQVAVWQRTGVFVGMECMLVVPMGTGATGMPLWLASVSVDGKAENVATGTSEGAAVRGVTARMVVGVDE